MDRLKCTVRDVTPSDRPMLLLIAEETLHPLAEQAGHPERFRQQELTALLQRARVFVAEARAEVAGYVAVEEEGDATAVRCLCVSPAHEAQAVAHQLLDWVEGLAISEGRARLVAAVPAADERSLHLYRGHDFVARPHGADADTLTLEKVLPGA